MLINKRAALSLASVPAALALLPSPGRRAAPTKLKEATAMSRQPVIKPVADAIFEAFEMGQRSRAAVLVSLSVNEVTFLAEVVVNIGMDRGELLK